jgi:hypothetical protein
MNSKKLLIVLGVVIVLIGAGVYLYIKINPTTPNENGERNTNIFSFFPFGSKTLPTSPTGNGEGEDSGATTTPIGFIPQLRQLSNVPTSGSISFLRTSTSSTNVFIGTTTATSTKRATTTTETVIRFIERITGHIYETTATSLTQERVVNQTIPKVYEAYFGVKGDSFITRTLRDEIEIIDSNYYSFFKATTTDDLGKTIPINKLNKALLPYNIKSLLLSPSKKQLFYLIETESEGSIGYLAQSNGSGEKILFESELSEWNIEWPNEDTIVLSTKADSSLSGFAYSLNTKTGRQNKIIGDINGLTIKINPSLTQAIYSEGVSGTINTTAYTLKDGFRNPLRVRTLPEKCVWSTKNSSIAYCAVPRSLLGGTYPEDWYKGLISFNDHLWKIDLTTNTYTNLLKPEEVGKTNIDMINLYLSEKEDFIYFTNKKDLTLWSYQLTQ